MAGSDDVDGSISGVHCGSLSPDDADSSVSWLPMPCAARQEWSKVYVDPATACLVYIHCIFIGHGALVAGYLAGYTWFTWHAHLCALTTLAAMPVFIAGMWLRGVRFNASLAYTAITFVQGSMAMIATAVTLVGPLNYSMFNSRVITLAVFALSTFFLALSSTVAPAPAALPEKPHTSMAPLLMSAADMTMRFMNALTDITIVRIILDQAEGGCIWFGRRISCDRYKVQAYAAGALSGIHFCTTIFRLLQQPQSNESAPNSRRIAVAVAVASIAELGNVAVVLLKLGSDFLHPDIAADSAAAQRLRSEAAFTVVSCMLSVAAVAVDIIGYQRLMATVNRVAASMRRIPARAAPNPGGGPGQKPGVTEPAACCVDSATHAVPGDAAVLPIAAYDEQD